jgi:hypothetical protein
MTLQDKLSLIQTAAMVVGVVFAVWQIKVAVGQLKVAADSYTSAAQQTTIAARAASSSTLGSLAAATREFQWKVLEDSTLHPLLLSSAGNQVLTNDLKLAVVRAMLISHYAFIYEYAQLGQMDGGIWKAITADMHDFFTKPDNQARWNQIKSGFSPKFREFVDREIVPRT